MAVRVNFSDEEARLLWCRGARAIAGFKKASSEGNAAAMGYYGGWMASVMQSIVEASPEELRPDGNETDKP